MDEALASYDKALVIKPDFADAYYNRGNVLSELNRMDEALASYDKALVIRPDDAESHYHRANALRELNRMDEALASYDKALAIRPDDAESHYYRGNTLIDLKRLDEALVSYDKALAFNPDYAEAHNNRGNTLALLNRMDDAHASFGKALAINPDYEFLFGAYLHTKMKVCDWIGLSDNLYRFETEVYRKKKVTVPFPALSLIDKPELHQLTSQVYAKAKYLHNPANFEQKIRYASNTNSGKDRTVNPQKIEHFFTLSGKGVRSLRKPILHSSAG